MDTMFITTASKDKEEDSGHLFVVKVKTQGVKEDRFKDY